MRRCIPGQRVWEPGESVPTSREFLPELGGGEACRVPVICKMVTDANERVIAEGDEVAVGEKPPVVGPEIRPPLRALETGDPSPMRGRYRVAPPVAAFGDPAPVVDDSSGGLAVQHVRIDKYDCGQA